MEHASGWVTGVHARGSVLNGEATQGTWQPKGGRQHLREDEEELMLMFPVTTDGH